MLGSGGWVALLLRLLILAKVNFSRISLRLTEPHLLSAKDLVFAPRR
jgi:hypothetical protein